MHRTGFKEGTLVGDAARVDVEARLHIVERVNHDVQFLEKFVVVLALGLGCDLREDFQL